MKGSAHHVGPHKTLSHPGTGQQRERNWDYAFRWVAVGWWGEGRESLIGQELKAYVRVYGQGVDHMNFAVPWKLTCWRERSKQFRPLVGPRDKWVPCRQIQNLRNTVKTSVPLCEYKTIYPLLMSIAFFPVWSYYEDSRIAAMNILALFFFFFFRTYKCSSVEKMPRSRIVGSRHS